MDSFVNCFFRPQSKLSKLEVMKDEEDTGDEEDENDEPEIDVGPGGIQRIRSENDISEFASDTPFLVYYNSILELARTNTSLTCNCGSQISIIREVVASAFF